MNVLRHVFHKHLHETTHLLLCSCNIGRFHMFALLPLLFERLRKFEANPRGWGWVVKQLVRLLSSILLHSKTKTSNSPICCWITTIPTTQSLLQCIRGRWNARGGWCTTTGGERPWDSVGDWGCRFFCCCRCRRQWWMAWQRQRISWALVDAVTSWEEAAEVWRHLVECRHQQSAIDWWVWHYFATFIS